jgi:hypothetical protein
VCLLGAALIDALVSAGLVRGRTLTAADEAIFLSSDRCSKRGRVLGVNVLFFELRS